MNHVLIISRLINQSDSVRHKIKLVQIVANFLQLSRHMHPDSVTDWLKKFSKRLGHAQVSTTANIYAHVMEEADERNADILADVFLKKA